MQPQPAERILHRLPPYGACRAEAAGGRSAGRQIHLPEKEQGIDRQGDGACKPPSERYAQTQSLCGRQGQNQQRVRLLCCGHAPRSDPEAKNGSLPVHRIYAAEEKGV